MITKFHHYIFPAVPPLALLIGVLLDRMLGQMPEMARGHRSGHRARPCSRRCRSCSARRLYGRRARRRSRGCGRGRAGDLDRSHHGFPAWLCVLLIALGVCAVRAGARRAVAARTTNDAPSESQARANAAVFGLALLGGAVLVAFAGRDLSGPSTERPLGPERLIQLFIYNYGRPFPRSPRLPPDSERLRVVAFVRLLVLRRCTRLRKVALYGLLVALAFWFAAWALDVYMIDLTPHWGQRELIKRYYEERRARRSRSSPGR